jgi:hypothetical protein
MDSHLMPRYHIHYPTKQLLFFSFFPSRAVYRIGKLAGTSRNEKQVMRDLSRFLECDLARGDIGRLRWRPLLIHHRRDHRQTHPLRPRKGRAPQATIRHMHLLVMPKWLHPRGRPDSVGGCKFHQGWAETYFTQRGNKAKNRGLLDLMPL